MEAVRFELRWLTILTLAMTAMASDGSPASASVASAAVAAGTQLRAAAERAGRAPLAELAAGAWPGRPASDLLLAAADRLAAKLTATHTALVEMKKSVDNDTSLGSFVLPCPLNAMKRNPHYREKEQNLSSNSPETLERLILATKRFEDVYDLKIKRQYFLSAADGATPSECRLLSDDARLRSLFHRYYQPFSKRVAVIVDNGKDISTNELQIAKSITVEILNLLQETDTIEILAEYDEDKSFKGVKNCTFSILDLEKNKEFLIEYIDHLEIANETMDISNKIAQITDSFFDYSQNVIIIYIGSDANWIKQAQNVSNVIERMDKNLNYSVVINTCNVGSSNHIESFWKIDLLKMPNCSENAEFSICRGVNVQYDSLFTIGQLSSILLLSMSREIGDNNMLAANPIWDPIQRDLLVPFLLPSAARGLIIVDLYLADLAQDIIYFNQHANKRRAFIVNFDGYVIMHSSYSRPEAIAAKPKLVDISFLEIDPRFETVKSAMFSNSSGKSVIRYESKAVVYIWKWVKNTYIICIASEIDKNDENLSNYTRRVMNRSIRELQYHRIDLWPPPNGELCRHFKQVSTVDRGTLYLSPSSFQSPFNYLYNIKSGKDMSFKVLQSCMAYLKDTSRLLSNPGLKLEIRNDVGLLYPMLNYYKRQYIHGSYNKYVVRRYAATDHGVLVMFPGSVLESDYEPNRKAWFMKAVQNPGRIILTQPYLDAGGAGYIVTISYALKDSFSNVKPSLVVAMDITIGFLHKIVADSSRFCSTPNVKCFIMDEQGYLLSHPSLFDRRKTGPIEQQHITHKESLIAIDMLNHKNFVQKNLCKNFVDGTLQRFYSFNTSISEVLTNVINGEHCARYHIAAIQGTNTFFGMVNSTCDMGAFCACNVVDRLCLICNRMEQNECECPCECALPEPLSCNSSSVSVPICELQPEKNNHKNHFFYNMATHLKPCFDFQCDTYRTESNCLGVLGCEWCRTDNDGETLLSSPFCSNQAACFGGVFGAVTPYGEGSLGHVMQDDILATYSAVGPIAGCIVAVCLILALAVYCYKQNLSVNSASDAYIGVTPDTWPDPAVQMSHIPSEDDIHDEHSGHQEKLLLANDMVTVPISPYRVLTGYKRPNTTGESDHGYSTMTPHDDSEHLAFGTVETLTSSEANSSGDLTQSSNILLRTNITDPITVLPYGRNNVIAPVTVHRNMEAA